MDIKCPRCQTQNKTGQKFCGGCGQRLKSACPQCGQVNPKDYKFCGQCGADLSGMGTIVLARSGLITQVSSKVLEVLGYAGMDMHGKPFSLFVVRDDLVIFFAHWNELLNGAETQVFEIALMHKEQRPVYVLLECCVAAGRHPSKDTIAIQLKEKTKNYLAAAQWQTQQELLALILSVTHNISTASKRHLAISIEDALKKICLFARADYSFIYSVNRYSNRLDLLYQWRQPASAELMAQPLQSVALSKVKNTIVRLRQDKSLVLKDLSAVEQWQRDELLYWHNINEGALICYLFYSGKIPIGIIGVADAAVRAPWRPECTALIRYFGDFLSAWLPSSPDHHQPTQTHSQNLAPEKSSSPVLSFGKPSPEPSSSGGHGLTAGKERSGLAIPRHRPKILMDMSRPMLFKKNTGEESLDKLRVFAREDGLVLLTCPDCGLQESVSVKRFEKDGGSLRVDCPCHKLFAAVLEKRQFFRKSVRLDGYFSLGGDLGMDGSSGSIWGQMIVNDLSRAGLRFSTEKAHLIKPGDLLVVRFNLDNTSRALIQKTARVITVNESSIGCRFEGEDSFDITLGFYFM